MLNFVQSKVALEIKGGKTLKQAMDRSKCLNNVSILIFYIYYCMKNFWIKYVIVYFILLSSLTQMKYRVLHPLKKLYLVSE